VPARMKANGSRPCTATILKLAFKSSALHQY